MISQDREVSPPLKQDKDLVDFAEVIQGNFRNLFLDAHLHGPKTAAPADADGLVGDIFIVHIATVWYLYAKVAANTWKRCVLG